MVMQGSKLFTFRDESKGSDPTETIDLYEYRNFTSLGEHDNGFIFVLSTTTGKQFEFAVEKEEDYLEWKKKLKTTLKL
jgi:hypothetical protein